MRQIELEGIVMGRRTAPGVIVLVGPRLGTVICPGPDVIELVLPSAGGVVVDCRCRGRVRGILNHKRGYRIPVCRICERSARDRYVPFRSEILRRRGSVGRGGRAKACEV